MAQADPEHRHLRFDQFFDLGLLGFEDQRIAGTVGEKYPVDLTLFKSRDQLFGRRSVGCYFHGDTGLHQFVEDVALDAEIECHDPSLRLWRVVVPESTGVVVTLAMLVGLFGAHLFDIVDFADMGRRRQTLGQFRFVGDFGGGDHHHRPLLTEHLGQIAGIDVADAQHVEALQKFVQRLLCAKVGGFALILADDDPFAPGTLGLHILLVAPHVADFGHRKGHKLPGVAGIGDDLLIPRHRRIEDHFTRFRPFGTEASRLDIGTVFKVEPNRSHHIIPRFLSSSS